jgi:hypothetical protein
VTHPLDPLVAILDARSVRYQLIGDALEQRLTKTEE